MLGWTRAYQRAWLGPDLAAGIALAAVLLPQGMAYAEVAGLPVVNGLYATLVPLVAFAIFGASEPRRTLMSLPYARALPVPACGVPRDRAPGAQRPRRADRLIVR